jgi:hypothetical protein
VRDPSRFGAQPAREDALLYRALLNRLMLYPVARLSS